MFIIFKNIRNKLILYITLILTTILILFVIYNKNNLITYNETLYCKKLDYEQSLFFKPENFRKINIELFVNEKKFSKILLTNLNELLNFNYVKNKREKTEARIKINFDNNKYCLIDARVRPHGDLKDHYEFESINNFRLPSLRVELKDTHIFGIVEFILFRPETRNYLNEIYVTSLFSEMGFLSPKTSLANVTFKEKNESMIFQEVINKEFLESNNLVEGPLLSGDERFVFEYALPDLSWHKIDNKSWIKDDPDNFENSKKAIEILNISYHRHKHNIENLGDSVLVDYFTSTYSSNFNKFFYHLSDFDALKFATYSLHGFPRDDRRFYFDTVNNMYLPILYDTGSTQNDGRTFNFPFIKYQSSSKTIIYSSIFGAEKVLAKIINLNKLNFKNKLIRRGFILYNNNVENRLKKTKSILKYLIYLKSNLEKGEIDKKLIYPIDFKKRNFFEKESFPNELFKNTKYIITINNKYWICDMDLTNCNKIAITLNQKKSLINQSLKITNQKCFSNLKNIKECTYDTFIKKVSGFKNREDNRVLEIIYLGDKKWFEKSHKYKIENYKYQKNKKVIYINENTSVNIFGNIDIEINKESKIIDFFRSDNKSAVVIKNGSIKNWKINFYDKTFANKNEIKQNTQKKYGLNGCLNFYDINVDNLKIQTSGTNCEDAINFVRVNGNVEKINSKNSLSDSVDFDFSNLYIKNINIIDSGNDCIDFSYGNYEIDNIEVLNCGDKALSVGENSHLKSKRVKISNSDIGIAAKDYAKFFGTDINISDVNTCLSAYKKKQEFSGGYMFIKNLECENYNIFKDMDKQSKIITINTNDI